MGEKQCFGLPTNPNDEIWHFRFGKCALVLSRLYALVILVVFCVLAGYYLYLHPTADDGHHHGMGTGEEIDTPWTEYIEDCGGETVVENFVHAKRLFENKYENNIINWKGYFAETKPTAG
jgi:hypothetical protein